MQAARGTSLNPGDTHTPGRQLPSRRSVRIVFVVTALVAYVVDLVTKVIAVEKLTDRGRVDLIGDLLGLHLIRNPGAAFSTGTGATAAFSVLAVVATAVVLWLAPRVRTTFWAFGFGLLLAGITGNLTDRIFRSPGPLRGHVVDFLELPHWPIFNVADICLNAAVVVIVIQTLRGVRLDGSRHQAAR